MGYEICCDGFTITSPWMLQCRLPFAVLNTFIMPRISWRPVFAFAVLHMVATMAALLFALATFAGMDDPDGSTSMLAEICGVAFVVLAQPGMILWTTLGHFAGTTGNISDAYEWLLFAGNSLVWGVGLAFLRAIWLRRRNRSRVT